MHINPIHLHNYSYSELERISYISGSPVHRLFENTLDVEVPPGVQAEMDRMGEDLTRLLKYIKGLHSEIQMLNFELFPELAASPPPVTDLISVPLETLSAKSRVEIQANPILPETPSPVPF